MTCHRGCVDLENVNETQPSAIADMVTGESPRPARDSAASRFTEPIPDMLNGNMEDSWEKYVERISKLA